MIVVLYCAAEAGIRFGCGRWRGGVGVCSIQAPARRESLEGGGE